MLSRLGALPDFTFLMAASSSSTVKSDDRLASAVAAPESNHRMMVSIITTSKTIERQHIPRCNLTNRIAASHTQQVEESR